MFLILVIGYILCKTSRIDNGVVTIGIDTEYGGAITFFADDNSHTNVINCHDMGREVQMSFYSGPSAYKNCQFMGHSWPWNPIGAGDIKGHKSQVLDIQNDGKTLYVKTLPLQWACDNVPCNCIFEKWITLDQNAAWVKNKLTMNRTDHTFYGARDQELPAMYSNGFLYRLFSYVGSKPWTGDKLSELPAPPPPNWSRFTASENWAAMVAENNYGFGVYNPNVTEFLGGFSGKKGKGGEHDSQTGYVAPVEKVQLNWNEEFEYSYALVLGYVDDIRSYIYGHRRKNLKN